MCIAGSADGWRNDGAMMRADLRVRLADGTDVGYAEAGDPDGHPVLHLHGTPGARLEVGIRRRGGQLKIWACG